MFGRKSCIEILTEGFPGGQWLRIHLPVQGTQVPSLVREDPACRQAAKPSSFNSQSPRSGVCDTKQEKPLQREARVPQLKKSP